MRRIFIFAVPMILGACALTPGEVITQGERETFQAAGSAKQLIHCSANVLHEISGITPIVKHRDDGTAYRIVLQGKMDTGTMAVVDFEATAPTVAAVTTYVSPNVLGGRGMFTEIRMTVDKCLGQKTP